MEHFYARGCNIAVTWLLESSWLRPILERAGFVARQTPHDLIVRAELGEYAQGYLTDPSNWHFTMGDSDYF